MTARRSVVPQMSRLHRGPIQMRQAANVPKFTFTQALLSLGAVFLCLVLLVYPILYPPRVFREGIAASWGGDSWFGSSSAASAPRRTPGGGDVPLAQEKPPRPIGDVLR